MTTTEAQTETPQRAGIETTQLSNALKNALLFVGKDKWRPILSTVQIEFEPNLARFISTDSFRILVQEVPCDSAVSGSFLLDRADAERWVKVLGVGAPNSYAAVGIVEDKLELRVLGSVSDAAPAPYDFPNWRQLAKWDEPIELGADAQVSAFNPKFLADIGKLKSSHRNSSVRIETNALKPMRFDLGTADGKIYGALMPVRV